jgi:hypothetical protein
MPTEDHYKCHLILAQQEWADFEQPLIKREEAKVKGEGR